jgi:hypothetical protein
LRLRLRNRTVEPPPDGLFERAIFRFNASPAGATAAGLTRTLGTPRVSVGSAAAAPDLVRVTVAWELTWYQWGVDLGDEGRGVFDLRRGTEIAEIDAAARQWNASVGEGGRVVLGTRVTAPTGATPR